MTREVIVLGAKRLGYRGETTRVENRGEATRGKRPGGRFGGKRLVTDSKDNSRLVECVHN